MMRTNNNTCSGYAAIFYNALMPLNDRADFKMKFRAVDKSYMIDSPYWGCAVRITVNHGNLIMEEVSKTARSLFLEERLGCNAYIKMPMNILLAFASGQIGIFAVAVRWLMGSVEVRGHFNLFGLLVLFKFFQKSSSSIA
jgi:hypothetical protein